MEWTISIKGKNELGDVCRREVRIDKSDERLRDGDIGLSISDGKRIMATLQSAVVNLEAETYALFRRVCPDCHTFRPVKDYTTRRIRTVFGTVEVRNPRWMLCRDCHPGMDAAFAPLKEICPDRATPELMELTARLGSLIPYRQAASVLAEFLPVEPTETHATVRKRTIKVGERLDDQITKESWCARTQMDEQHQLEMQLPGDRRKEFVVSIDTAHVRSADANSARNFEVVVARCGRGGRGDAGGRYFTTSNTGQHAIRDRAVHALRRAGYCGFGDVAVISDGAEILKRLPRAMPKPTTHIIDWFRIAMKIQPMQQIADHMVRSHSGLTGALPSIDKDIRAVKWRLWHGRVDRAIRDLVRLVAEFKTWQEEGAFAAVRLHNLGAQLVTYIRSNCGAIINYGKRYRAGLRVATTLAESAVNSLVAKRMVKKQQMRWSQHGAHMLMQVRTADMNGELRDRLRARFRLPEPQAPSLFKPKPPLLRAA
ncbi:ISKra4 family transposase [Mesorhizobium sp. BAC0120]|uniref:ISKra4 family transposase n=1 Tax=Mesorhizobium sp. BAC0120 TaxID=3090670 RepID=UPI00298C0614|nr:ISKra4 family transposase [Mesorhizobium sp. BAC0120]MDW6025886.1 ISKra4 family transposase [Mesorhizobium sp. BAC0120]